MQHDLKRGSCELKLGSMIYAGFTKGRCRGDKIVGSVLPVEPRQTDVAKEMG